MTDKPKAFGYMRLPPDADDRALIYIEDGILRFAEAHGLRLLHTYYEAGPGISPNRLIRRLIRDDIRHVIVPSLAQITELALPDWVLREPLEPRMQPGAVPRSVAVR
jgi:hypothetical protein